jgi:hypothetical protein
MLYYYTIKNKIGIVVKLGLLSKNLFVAFFFHWIIIPYNFKKIVNNNLRCVSGRTELSEIATTGFDRPSRKMSAPTFKRIVLDPNLKALDIEKKYKILILEKDEKKVKVQLSFTNPKTWTLIGYKPSQANIQSLGFDIVRFIFSPVSTETAEQILDSHKEHFPEQNGDIIYNWETKQLLVRWMGLGGNIEKPFVNLALCVPQSEKWIISLNEAALNDPILLKTKKAFISKQ